MMYAIAFNLDQEMLSKACKDLTYATACSEIERILKLYGFVRQQSCVYFGEVDAVHCILAVQSIAKRFPWFSASLKNIQMFRIEDNNDLMPAVDAVL